MKYSPVWSLLCRVIQVKDKVLVVAAMGLSDYHREVPIAQVKALKKEFPEPLAELNLKLLQVTDSTFIRRPVGWFSSSAGASRKLSDIVDDAFRMRKRPRKTSTGPDLLMGAE